MGCDAARNMFLEIHNCGKQLDCNVGKLPKLHVFTVFHTGTRLPDAWQWNGMRNSEAEMYM